MKKRKSKANAFQFKKVCVLLDSMVKKNIKNQYRRSFLGIVWTILNPLLNMIVMAFVFTNIFGRSNIEMDYPVFVLSGTIVFSLMASATKSSLTCIVDSYDLLTKTRVPYSVFPLSRVLSSAVNFLFALIALLLVMVVRILSHAEGVAFHWSMFLIVLPWLPSILIFSLGLSLVLCSIYVRFRDIKHIYSVVLTLWRYLTPVFYSLATLRLDATAEKIMKLNPMLHYLNYFRDAIMGNVPGLKELAICYGAAIVMFAIGALIFKAMKKKFILYI